MADNENPTKVVTTVELPVGLLNEALESIQAAIHNVPFRDVLRLVLALQSAGTASVSEQLQRES